MPESQDAAPYQVLARKYRPQSFNDLIGHEAMVKTLRNAFSSGRIAHAYVLTGVRGVGKTTTARILARALNYVGPNGEDNGPQIDMAQEGLHCRAIAESRHPDVLEMDAASRTGVGDIRELIEGVRYAPVEARYKVYIIDEVHMLSTAAFNALLKTLEEPPPHVKFIFATTEIRKLPVTVLSRCQRFDLRRIDPDVLTDHLAAIAQKEKVEVEREGLFMIARAAEGSVRDALSILDQAIVQNGATGEPVNAASIRDMLGLADRTQVWDLLSAVFSGDAKTALEHFRTQYDAGADPGVVLRDMLELVHLLTRVKAAGPDAAGHGAAGEADAERARDMAGKLSLNALTRAWSLLMKGLSETREAPDPAAAGEMALIRLAYAADLPTPDEALRMLKRDSGSGIRDSGSVSAQPNPESRIPSPKSALGGGGYSAEPAREEAFPEPQARRAPAGPELRSFAD
ncbi:MAG TPA: DNA polymerase III subunit gamma/tau, partial [Parvularculaceae bacterium]|nr:DNA polymerase III subunit gamma/tau [Parvularculaceae bacterium]